MRSELEVAREAFLAPLEATYADLGVVGSKDIEEAYLRTYHRGYREAATNLDNYLKAADTEKPSVKQTNRNEKAGAQ